VAQRIRRITDNLTYILGMEMMHAAQAITLRQQQNPKLRLGVATEAAYETYRRAVPWYDRDRNLSADIEASYQAVKSRRLLDAAEKVI
jgi:histidine ammonia-lyase